jgi:hypothetical protein
MVKIQNNDLLNFLMELNKKTCFYCNWFEKFNDVWSCNNPENIVKSGRSTYKILIGESYSCELFEK